MHVFTNKFYGKDGVCLALLGQLMTNIRYAFREWYVSTHVCACMRACVRACVRDNYVFKIYNHSENVCMHLAGNRSSTLANLEAGDGLSVIAVGQGKQTCFIVDPVYLNRVQLDIYV